MTGETYRRWAAGWCPCCGSDIAEYEGRDGEVTGPEVIAEQVMICGRCSAMEHLRVPGLTEALLAAIALRSEKPIEDLLPGSWLNCVPSRGDGAVRA